MLTETTIETLAKNEKKPRRSRFKRDKAEAKRTLVFTSRDYEVLKHLYNARSLTSQQLWDLVCETESRGTKGSRALLRRLRRLFDHGYIDRMYNQQFHVFDPRDQGQAGRQDFVYGLSNDGAELLAQAMGDLALQMRDFSENNREIQWPQIQHSLMISQAYVALHWAAKLAPNMKIHEWLQGQELYWGFYADETGAIKDEVDPEEARRRGFIRHSVRPDAFFSLYRTDTHTPLYFFLEADRGTMSAARFNEKIQSYLLFKRHNLLGERLPGVTRFVVLTVTKSAARRDNLVRAVRQLPRIENDPGTFRFAHEGQYLDSFEAFREQIWFDPVTKQWLKLLQ